MNNLCVIPARGGSKRIPRKNIKEFCGKPIIAYSIEAAKESNIFSDIIVSTDDEEIASVAKKYGATVPFIRQNSLADDFTGTTPVIANAIEEMANLGKTYNYICCIYATAPFVNSQTLQLGYEKLLNSNKNFAFSVCAYSSPIFRSFELLNDGSVQMFWQENFNKRSQDLPKAYFDAAQFYFGKPEAFLQNMQIFAPHSIGVEQDIAQDIDTIEDWHMAEALYKAHFCK
ncbi:MAG: hypothetical protein RL154_957 [Pseudomonadota bacterium]|jgi:pseudaminic acid cytidylyltransferase